MLGCLVQFWLVLHDIPSCLEEKVAVNTKLNNHRLAKGFGGRERIRTLGSSLRTQTADLDGVKLDKKE